MMASLISALRRHGIDLADAEYRRMALLLSLASIYVLAVHIVGRSLDEAENIRLAGFSKTRSIVFSLTLIFIGLAHYVAVFRTYGHHQALPRFWQDVRKHVLPPKLLITRAVPLFCVSIFLAAFLSLKSLIPDLNPYTLDEFFYRLDLQLHFDHDPWRLTHALFGSIFATALLNWAYNVWFLMQWLIFIVFLIRVERPGLRLQYFISALTSWILLGSLMAVLLSSAGPCYYADVTGLESPYAPLIAKLYATDAHLQETIGIGLHTLRLQETLWTNYSVGIHSMTSGISAMPSMHVAIATLMALGCWRLNRKLGWVMIGYAAAIMIGSVHFGWHYAVDGYVSIIGAVVIWKAVGWSLIRLGLHDNQGTEIGPIEEQAPTSVQPQLR